MMVPSRARTSNRALRCAGLIACQARITLSVSWVCMRWRTSALQVARSSAETRRGSGCSNDKDGGLTSVNVAVFGEYARACKEAQGVVVLDRAAVLERPQQEDVPVGAGDERNSVLDLAFVMPGQRGSGVA